MRAADPRELGGSVVTLDFDASLAWPGYDWMGVSKAALESVVRYLAQYLGHRRIRVNAVSAGPSTRPQPRAFPDSQHSPMSSSARRRWAGRP